MNQILLGGMSYSMGEMGWRVQARLSPSAGRNGLESAARSGVECAGRYVPECAGRCGLERSGRNGLESDGGMG